MVEEGKPAGQKEEEFRCGNWKEAAVWKEEEYMCEEFKRKQDKEEGMSSSERRNEMRKEENRNLQ